MDFDEKAKVPLHTIEIIAQYEKLSNQLKIQVEESWKDEMLKDDLNMYGQVWKRANVLSNILLIKLITRGQMTVLMRQAGLKVPGVYGPSKEEWAAFGMPTQE